MFAHGVDLADGGARAQQRARHRLLVLERYALGRRDPVGRGAARHQHQHEIVRACAVSQSKRAIGGLEARRIRDRMAGLDHANLAQMPRIAVTRDGDAAQAFRRNSHPVEVVRFGHLGHRARGLAGGEQYQPARRQSGGSRGGRHVAGCAADTAVRNSPARKERRLSFELPISAHCRKNLLI